MQYRAWLDITIARALLELANIIAATILLTSVRIAWKPKATVYLAFSVRLLIIPPSIVRLEYIRKALSSNDWSYSHTEVVIVTQVIIHFSVILATLPCIKPFLRAFKSGSLRASASFRRESDESRATEAHTARPTLFKSKSANRAAVAVAPGKAGHRQRIEQWPLQLWNHRNSTITTVEHDPEDAREAKRKRSVDSESMKGITKTKSFSVDVESLKEMLRTTPPGSVSGQVSDNITRATSWQIGFEDAGGLLASPPKAKVKENGNVSAMHDFGT